MHLHETFFGLKTFFNPAGTHFFYPWVKRSNYSKASCGIQTHTLMTKQPELEFDALNRSAMTPKYKAQVVILFYVYLLIKYQYHSYSSISRPKLSPNLCRTSLRFLSTPKGFKYLSEVNFVTHELEKWRTSYNCKYVTLVETEINEAFTCYQKPIFEGGFIRRSRDEKKKRKDVYVPVHLYGQLVQHKAGCETLEKQVINCIICFKPLYTDVLENCIFGTSTFQGPVKKIADIFRQDFFPTLV